MNECSQTGMDRGQSAARSTSKQLPEDHASCNEPRGPLAVREDPKVPDSGVGRR